MSDPLTSIHVGPLPQAARGLLKDSELPTSDLADEQINGFLYCGPATAPSALVGLEIHGDTALRSSP